MKKDTYDDGYNYGFRHLYGFGFGIIQSAIERMQFDEEFSEGLIAGRMDAEIEKSVQDGLEASAEQGQDWEEAVRQEKQQERSHDIEEIRDAQVEREIEKIR